MSDPTRLTLVEAVQALQTRQFSARELTQTHLDAIDAANPALNAYVHVCPDKALAMAGLSDARLAKGEAGALEGLPIGVKDLFCTQGTQTTAASAILQGFTPPYESTVTANLWQAGAVMLGKLNLDEFAMGSSNETSIAGPVVNPWRAKSDTTPRSPGGSSGGSAAAVAAGLCLAATGTDTGGSMRQPASFTGTVGIKPTYGRASRYGIIAFASSLDQAGPITRTLTDAALMLRVMCSHDQKDATSIKAETPDWTKDVSRGVKGLKIGIPKEYRMDTMPDEIEALWQQGANWLREAGAEIIEVCLPHTSYALPAYYIIAPAEASSNLARYDGMRYGLRCEQDSLVETYEATRAAGFGDEVKRRLLIGSYVLSAGYYDAYYLRAQKVRTRVAQDFRDAFTKVDALLTPTTPGSAFALGQKTQDPIAMYLNDVFTATASLAGLPALSVPAGTDAQGLPLGLQVIAPALDESVCFRIGGVIEQAAAPLPPPENWWSEAGS